MMAFPNPTPRRRYCRKHGIEYSGYFCPECREKKERDEGKKANSDSNFQKLLDSVFSPKKQELNINSTSSEDSTAIDGTVPTAISDKVQGTTEKKDAGKTKGKKIDNSPIKVWHIALLLIFALSIIGLGISLFAGTLIPFWLMLIFSFYYSIEKWFYYFVRGYKVLGNLYRLSLNLSILLLIGIVVWTGNKVFSQNFTDSQLLSSLILLAELILFVWIWRVIGKNRRRWPSMRLTVFSLMCLFLIFAFAGVNPMSLYKDNLVSEWNTFQLEREEERKQEEEKQEEEKPKPYGVLQFQTFNDESTGFRVDYPEGWITNIISTGDEVSTRVSFEGKVGQSSDTLSSLLIGYDPNVSDARGLWTSMVNLASSSLVSKGNYSISRIQGYELTQEINGRNSRIFVGDWESGLLLAYRSYPMGALDPSEVNMLDNCLEHLIVTASKLESKSNIPESVVVIPAVPKFPTPVPVSPKIENPDIRNPSWEELKAFLLEDDTDKMEYVFPTTVCEDFAKKLQGNAKEAGWRCAFVSVQLDGYPDWANLGIPSYTGHACNAFETTDRGLIYIDCTSTIGAHPLHQDAIVDVKIGNDYIPKLIFPSPGWSSTARNMGKIADINTIRW
ncbi:hypothetical protein ACFLWN_03625 [Chloroflexota bacterium]